MPAFEFKGKSHVYAHHLTVPFRPLVPDPAKSVGDASPDGNLIIHGDNLAALKALLPRYAGQVKCVYIDPPYNTGNEGWVYNDNTNGPLLRSWYKARTPVDGEDLERHDKWLTMMWPRLQLLKELLAEDGVIFISIDDNEHHHLRMLMDDIFGERNFVANIVWNHQQSRQNDMGITLSHDLVLAYAKDRRRFSFRTGEIAPTSFTKLDDDPRGRRVADPTEVEVSTVWDDVGTASSATAELSRILGRDNAFDAPKPTSLVKRIVRIATGPDALVLDSFAGSGTTGQAVLELNREDGGDRSFILIECDECADTVTAERVRRVIEGVPGSKDAGARKGLGGSFSFCELGPAIGLEAMLTGEELPSYATLATWLLQTATGIAIDGAELEPLDENGLFHRDTESDWFLLWKPSAQWLRSDAAVLDESRARSIRDARGDRRRRAFVFAPAKYMAGRELTDEFGITFHQLPYDLHRPRVGR